MSEFNEYNTYSTVDKSSYSNPHAIKISSIHLDWNINFDLRLIQGSVKHSCETIIDGTNSIDRFKISQKQQTAQSLLLLS